MFSRSNERHSAKFRDSGSVRQQRRALQTPARTGSAVVEFAVVAPLMLSLTLGMMEVSRMVMVKQLMVNATREGARLAVLPGSTAQEVMNKVSQDLAQSSISGVTVNVQPQALDSTAAGTPITVSVSVSATAVSWIPKPMFSFNQTLAASTTMRKENL